MGAGFHNEIVSVNAERVNGNDAAPRDGIMVMPRREDYQRLYVGDPEPQRVQSLLHTAAYGEPGAQQELFDKMLESDPHIRCEAKKRCMAVTGLEWDVESASLQRDADLSDAETELADDIAKDVRKTLRRIEGLRSGLCHLVDAVARGLTVVEVEWITEGGRRRPKALHCVPGFRLRYDHNDPWRLRITESVSDFTGEPVDEQPLGKFLVHAPAPIGGMPVRGGLLRTAVPWYIFKHYGVQFFMKALEIFGQPFRTATYGPNATADVRDQMLAMLELMGVTASGVFPQGTEFQVHESKMASSSSWPQERVIKMANGEISKLFVGATLMTEVGEAGGNRALGEVQDEVREDLRDDDIASESEVLAPLIRAIVMHGPYVSQGGLELLPRFTRVVPEPLDDEADAKRLDQAVNRWGMSVPVSYAVERFGIPVTDDVDTSLPLEGNAGSSPFDGLGFDELANKDRGGVETVANRTLDTIVKRRRTAAARLATWIFAAVAASGVHVENVIGAVSEFVSRRRDLETALAELPNAFSELPTDEMTALQEQYLLASRMAGMLQARGSIGRSVNRLRSISDFRFEISKDRVGPCSVNTDRGLALVANAETNFDAIPFVEAIEALRDRLGLNPEEFEALEAEARSRAFRVAAVWDMKLLSDIRRELAASIEAGETSRDFRRRLPEMAIRNGWSGENPWHADIVHFQNFAMAHAAGRYGEYREFGIDLWRFVANGDSCPICAPQVGKVFKLSDRRFFPPLHFWCDCEDEAVFEGEAGDGEVIDSGAIDNPDFDKQRARRGGFAWDPAQYARLEPVNLSAIESPLQARFETFATEQGWEVAR